MQLAEFIPQNMILVLEEVASWDELVQKLLAHTQQQGALSMPSEEVFCALKEREALASTIFEKGLAIPHAKIGGPTEMTGALALLKQPLHQAGKPPLKLMCLVVTAKKTADLYLSLLAALSMFIQAEGVEQRLEHIASAAELYALLRESDLSLETTLCAKHIMSKELLSCRPDTPLDAVLESYLQRNLTYSAVVDEQGQFLGKIRLNDILNLLIPDYAKRIGQLTFLGNFEPIKQFSQLKQDCRVADVYQKASYTAKPETTIVELLGHIAIHNIQNIPVVQQGKLVGHIGVQELLRKVLLEY